MFSERVKNNQNTIVIRYIFLELKQASFAESMLRKFNLLGHNNVMFINFKACIQLSKQIINNNKRFSHKKMLFLFSVIVTF